LSFRREVEEAWRIGDDLRAVQAKAGELGINYPLGLISDREATLAPLFDE
jgi:hypothetical protein